MKKWIVIAVIMVVAIVLWILFSSLWLGQNEGTIHLTVNGRPVDLDNIDISMAVESTVSGCNSSIKKNRFYFEGIYYWNYFSFTIPSSLIDGYASDIQVSFQTLNANEWHHVIHTLDINIVTSSSSECTMDITYTKLLPITDIGGIRFNEETSESLSFTPTPDKSSVSICDVME